MLFDINLKWLLGAYLIMRNAWPNSTMESDCLANFKSIITQQTLFFQLFLSLFIRNQQ